MASYLENATESQLGGVDLALPKGKKNTKKMKTAVRPSEKVQIDTPTSSAVSFKVPQVKPIDKEACVRIIAVDSPEQPDLPESTCSSDTRRKVKRWFSEQCATPASSDTSSLRSASTKETGQRKRKKVVRSDSECEEVACSARTRSTSDDAVSDDTLTEVELVTKTNPENETTRNDCENRGVDMDSVFTRETQSVEELALKHGPGDGRNVKETEDDTMSESSTDAGHFVGYDSTESGPVVSRRKGKDARIESTISTESSLDSEPECSVLRNAKPPRLNTGSRLAYLRGTPPSKFKGCVSSPGSDDPYAFKSSQKTPQKGKRKRGRGKGKKQVNSKRKKPVVSLGEGSFNTNEIEIVEQNRKSKREFTADKEKKVQSAQGITTMFTYGKESKAVLFDTLLDQNTDPFSSPADVGGKENNDSSEKIKQQQPQAKAKKKNKKKTSTRKPKTKEIVVETSEQVMEELEEVENYEFVFSQQIRDEAEEYRKMFKKKTKDNPRTNRVSFGDNVVVLLNENGSESAQCVGNKSVADSETKEITRDGATPEGNGNKDVEMNTKEKKIDEPTQNQDTKTASNEGKDNDAGPEETEKTVEADVIEIDDGEPETEQPVPSEGEEQDPISKITTDAKPKETSPGTGKTDRSKTCISLPRSF